MRRRLLLRLPVSVDALPDMHGAASRSDVHTASLAHAKGPPVVSRGGEPIWWSAGGLVSMERAMSICTGHCFAGVTRNRSPSQCSGHVGYTLLSIWQLCSTDDFSLGVSPNIHCTHYGGRCTWCR
jgi:hypothetical protein